VTRLVVEFDGIARTLTPPDTLTFGRDASCTLTLGRDDPTISRLTGQVQFRNGTWWITNVSTKNALDLRDAAGFPAPLPVSRSDLPPSVRAVDQERLTVFVAGRDRDYELVFRPEQVPRHTPTAAPADPRSTVFPPRRLTDNRREVVVALARGYLRTGGHHNPNPLTYAQVATLLGLTQATVQRRAQAVREQLTKDGVAGLQVGDARRALCEWLLRMRWIDPSDVDWLQPRIDAAAARRRAAAGPTE